MADFETVHTDTPRGGNGRGTLVSVLSTIVRSKPLVLCAPSPSGHFGTLSVPRRTMSEYRGAESFSCSAWAPLTGSIPRGRVAELLAAS